MRSRKSVLNVLSLELNTFNSNFNSKASGIG